MTWIPSIHLPKPSHQRMVSPNARGRILGGSSAINAGFYSRAGQAFFRESGVGQDLNVVNQSYEWVEKAIVFRPDPRN